MEDFDDLTLERPSADEPPPKGPSPWLLVVVVLGMTAGGAWYFLVRDRAPRELTATPPAAGELKSPANRPAEPGRDIPLPPLAESDALVRELVAGLTSHPLVAAWLTTDQLVRNFATVVDNISAGQGPARHLAAVRPSGSFQVRQAAGRTTIDPRGYQRYDQHARAVEAIDARGAAGLYATLTPRLDDAYREIGGAQGDFDRAIQGAIVSLLKTPIVDGEITLKSDSVSYTFADPALESLTPAQRQFLRMGPRNMRIVKAKLREIARHLGMPEDALPPADSVP